MRRSVPVVLAMLAALAAPAAASAGPLAQLYAPLHLNASAPLSVQYIDSHFPTISIQRWMAGRGYRVPTIGFYVKASRTPSGWLPESWYLHDWQGRRIRDKRRTNLYVMNISNVGWQDQVATSCRPDFCFLDGLGPYGYSRMNATPRELTASQWTQASIALATRIEAKSTAYRAVANNLSTVSNPPFEIGYESFAKGSAAASLAVLRRTTCFCFAKLASTQGARYGFALFLVGADAADRISVGTDPELGTWWPFYNAAAPLGSPTSSARLSGTVYSRSYAGGMVLANGGGSAQTVRLPRSYKDPSTGRSSSVWTIAGRDGLILQG